jgi:type VI secretion system protein ImpH
MDRTGDVPGAVSEPVFEKPVMEGIARTSDTTPAFTGPVLARLFESGSSFSFFQAVWLLERLDEVGTPVGREGPAAAESIHFRPDTSFAFPGADVRQLRVRESDSADPRYQMDVTFLGLYGVSTPLPLHYALDVLRQVETPPVSGALPAGADAAAGAAPSSATTIPEAHSPIRDFLDVLNHRLISLFYRSWTKYRYYATFGSSRSDDITSYLLWLIGLQPEWKEAILGLSPLRMIRYAGGMTQRPRSATMLEGILQDYWKDIPVEIRQCVGRWVTLSPSSLNAVGRLNSRLGEDLVVGEQIYDVSGSFDVTLGPMDWRTYESFLPDTDSFQKTQQLVRLFASDPLAFRIELKLDERQIPETRLAGEADGTSVFPLGGRLGFTSWVRTQEMPETSVTFSPVFGASN